jgi:hypothetical protein
MNELTVSQIYDKLKDDSRFAEYKTYEDLFNGDHYNAFSIKATEFKDQYSRLRYIVCNFTGLVSKVIADMLFGEPVSITDKDNQDFIDSLVFENKLDTLFYEHAITNSYYGDNLFKIRVENSRILIEDASPMLYIPELDPHNVRAKPKRIHLVSFDQRGKDEKYMIVETHEPPFVKMRFALITKDGLKEMDAKAYNAVAGTNYEDKVDTKIKRFLVIHVPNWKSKGHFGVSDFKDLKELVFALNNRMSKIDNILDKHSDPILAVPSGVLDEDGKVQQKAFTMFEMDEKGQKPEYIVWNANLENAITEIDKIVDFLFMFSETSPDALGLGKGTVAESGRALKMRLLRTIAKRNRKKIYYDQAIKELIYTCELLAKSNPSYTISDETVKLNKPQTPTTAWQDGIVNDETERVDIAIKKIDAGIMSKKKAVMDLESIEEDEAEELLKEVGEEDKAAMDFTSFVDNKGGDNPTLDKDGKPIEDKGGNMNQNKKPPVKK